MNRVRARVWWLAVPVALLAIGVASVVNRTAGGDKATVAAVGVTSTSMATGTTSPSTTAGPPVTTTTTAAPRTTLATEAPATTTTTAMVEPVGPTCTPAMFESRLKLDKASYRPGEVVTATATFTNTSGKTCTWASTLSGMEVYDTAGTAITVGAKLIADAFRPVPFAAGDTHTWRPTWDQKACARSSGTVPCTQAPPGRYTAVVTVSPYGEARATFDLVS